MSNTEEENVATLIKGILSSDGELLALNKDVSKFV